MITNCVSSSSEKKVDRRLKKRLVILLALFFSYCVYAHPFGNECDSLRKAISAAVQTRDQIKTQRLYLLCISTSLNRDSVEVALKKLLVKAKKHNETKLSANLYIDIGNCLLEQDKYDESLKEFANAFEEFAKEGNEEGKARAQSRMAAACLFIGDYNRSIELNELSERYFIATKDASALATCYGNIGIAYKRLGKLFLAIQYQNKSMAEEKKVGNKKGIASCVNAIGNIYFTQGDFANALKNYFEALKIQQETNYHAGISHALSNIGLVFKKQGDYKKALSYSYRSLYYDKLESNKQEQAISLSNIGDIYFKIGLLDSAALSFNQGISIFKEIDDQTGLADIYSSLGLLMEKKRLTDSAYQYHSRSLAIYQKQNMSDGEAVEYFNLAQCMMNKGNRSKALELAQRSLVISEKIGSLESMELAEEFLSAIYEQSGEHGKALLHFKKYTLYKDSLYNIEKTKDVTRNELKFEFEREAEKDSLENVHKAQIKDEQLRVSALEIKQQRTKGYLLWGGVVVLLLFGGFMYNRFKVTSEQKKIIEQQKVIVEAQKHLVEEQQQEIRDSINYAKRIQSSFMASEAQLKERLSEHFVLFRPKDVVSGDFYWADITQEKVFLCVGDSTGHGIPGAFMSLLNLSLLNEALLSKHYTETNLILDFVRRILILGLKPDESGQGGNDGMDCVTIRLDLKNLKLQFSGANNPLWLVRKGTTITLTPDKMPVGRSPKQDISFTSKEMDLEHGDVLYLFTDGFPDQFGGPKGKKFKYKQMEEYLLSIHMLPMQTQHDLLLKKFLEWKGDLEQVDDVCVMGIRV